MNLIIALLLLLMHEKNPLYAESSGREQKPLFSFGIIADVQYSDNDPSGNRYYRASAGRLREAIKIFEAEKVSFVVNLGDLIDNDYSSFKTVLGIIDSSELKTFHVTGNHDYAVEDRLKRKIPLLSDHREGYYSVSSNGFRFVFLNGNEISIYSGNKNPDRNAGELLEQMKVQGEINAVEWNGGFSQKQMDWLKKQLDEASAGNEPVFIFCHFPVFPVNVHNLLNYKDVLSLLEKYNNIIAWFSGHNHAGNYGNFNKIHFITFRGMVESEKDNSFAIVDVYSTRLWIRGYGREKNLILAY